MLFLLQLSIHIGNSDFWNESLVSGKITGLVGARLARNRKNKIVELIRVNITVYKGDSGGPLLDKNGHLIGLMAAKLKNKERMSLAIPSNKIKKLYLDFVK